MSGNSKIPVQAQEVYVVTDKGNKELRGSQTSLSPQQLEVLVLVDGMASVEAISHSVRMLKAEDVQQMVADLIAAGMLSLREEGGGDSGDLADMLSGKLLLTPAAGALAAAGAEAGIGEASLKRQGYYVSIGRRAAEGRHPPAGRKACVLIIEDDPSLSKLLKTFMSLEGFEPRVAMKRDEVLAEFRRPIAPDLVLLDLLLPDADGFDILAAMRRHPKLKSVPVVILSGKATRESVQKGLAGGADGYVTKPFEVEVLMTTVKAVLGSP